MSIVLAYQPHFLNQPENVQVFWGYGLFPDKKGNYVEKNMSDCTGKEILIELCSHLKFNADLQKILQASNCIPCMMPFITSQFMPRKARTGRRLCRRDRPSGFHWSVLRNSGRCRFHRGVLGARSADSHLHTAGHRQEIPAIYKANTTSR